MNPLELREVNFDEILQRQLRKILVGVNDGTRTSGLTQNDTGCRTVTPFVSNYIISVDPILGKVVHDESGKGSVAVSLNK